MPWTLEERRDALQRAASEPVDLLVVGGGITGAGVLRDAATRGLSALLLERWDFASGTSSATSKMIHGGLRYLAEAQPHTTYESCRERDRLARLNPNLVRPFPFLLPAYRGGLPPFAVKGALSLYTALGGFRESSRHRMIGVGEVQRYTRDLDTKGLRGAGLFYDQQVDDARFVLETLKSARRLGAEAIPHVEVTALLSEGEAVVGARARDALEGGEVEVRARAVVNATGPGVDRLLGLAPRARPMGLRPAKGCHVVLSAERLHVEAAVGFRAKDRRNVFVCPWEGVILVGTTDTFSDRVDEPVVTREDALYLLDAVNRAFPGANLGLADVLAVYSGVRPLVADPGEDRPSSVSRDDKVVTGPRGLVTVAGGKLTTHRAMAERVVDEVAKLLPGERRRAMGPCRTKELPLRDDRFERDALVATISGAHGLPRDVAEGLVSRWGEDAERLLVEADPVDREVIGRSRYVYAELAWAVREECALRLVDLLERRFRVAVTCPGQGLEELDRIVAVVARAAGWDEARAGREADAYREVVARRYRIDG